MFYKFLSLFLIITILNCCGSGGKGTPVQLSVLPEEEDNSSETLDPNTDIFIPKETFETPEYKNQWGLDFINASDAYSYGASGKGVVVGVVDEALDWGHHEFLRENILHPDSILTYSGNREPTPLEKFHGTATSSIIAGRKDNEPVDRNMHGVAYDAQILFISIELGSPPSDGEYEPIDIPAFSWERFDEQESEFYRELSSKSDVVNNSFGFTGQITDYSKETLENTFPKLINTFASQQETIFVWSAGNFNGIKDTGGEIVSAADPGILAGLGYYFPELAKNNVAVVAVDQNGDIAEFSNRCGVASEFCIAAPGVRVPIAIPNNLFNSLTEIEKESFNKDVLNYLEAHPTEAYLSASGTSFSAPHVTGAIAVLKELFNDNLSSAQILERLFNTANKEGKYSDKEIYGQGLLDLRTASSPVGSTLFYTESNIHSDIIPTTNSYVSTSKSFGDGLKNILSNTKLSVFDAFGAPFSIQASSLIKNIIPSSTAMERLFNFKQKKYGYISSNGFEFYSSWKRFLTSTGVGVNKIDFAEINFHKKNSSLSFSYGKNPSTTFLDTSEELFIYKSFYDKEAFINPWLNLVEEGYSLGFSNRKNILFFDLNIFSGFKRDDDWFLKPNFYLDKNKNESKGLYLTLRNNNLSNFMIGYTLGLLETNNGVLDNNFNGAFSITEDSKSFFSSISFKSALAKDWSFIGSLNFADISNINSNKFIRNISNIEEFSFDIALIKKSIFNKNDSLSFRIKQDPRIEAARISFYLPEGRDPSGSINFKSVNLPIRPSGREINLETSWSFQNDNKKSYINLNLIKDKGHIKTNNIELNLIFAYQRFF
ncbi:MAG: S8 family peptidase [Alphaproteobacteria bacterium]